MRQMSALEITLARANVLIASVLKSDLFPFDPLFEALAGVGPFLPVEDPTPPERAALLKYRANLEQLLPALQILEERLQTKRGILQTQLDRIKAQRAYSIAPG